MSDAKQVPPDVAMRFARLMHEGLERDQWGTIDPVLFAEIAESDPDMSAEACALATVIHCVLSRMQVTL